MTRNYCTACLSLYGKYYNLLTLYKRKDRNFVVSGNYQCENCLIIACENYEEMVELGNKILRSFEEVRET